ncbi:hypothetical protein O181_060936 [Austropuccinia psidii MF-1]|uniref:Uncharacterized protein n=1 Tax=Austropuccinia psidii MF-1 TaxID=1389203 RepID=A0A9Q3EF31_9BASI|nr:hypothetical protein [Austropuccinia psidii MF-1]
MNSLGTITKTFIIPHKKGDFRLEPDFVVLNNGKLRGFILGTEYQRIYGKQICNSINRNLKFGTEREKKFSFDSHMILSLRGLTLENFLEELKEEEYRALLKKEQNAVSQSDEKLQECV